MLYGTGELKGVGDAFRRGAKTGALSSELRNIEEALWPERSRDPKRMCGTQNPFDLADGVGNGRGYHGGAEPSRTGEGGFSLGGLVKDMVIGGILGGLGSAGFYGAGKAVDALKSSVVGRRNDHATHVPSSSTRVIHHPEIKASYQIKVSDVTNYWDDYLGNNQTNISLRTGLMDFDRIFFCRWYSQY